jgi:hypothetical protein
LNGFRSIILPEGFMHLRLLIDMIDVNVPTVRRHMPKNAIFWLLPS